MIAVYTMDCWFYNSDAISLDKDAASSQIVGVKESMVIGRKLVTDLFQDGVHLHFRGGII